MLNDRKLKTKSKNQKFLVNWNLLLIIFKLMQIIEETVYFRNCQHQLSLRAFYFALSNLPTFVVFIIYPDFRFINESRRF